MQIMQEMSKVMISLCTSDISKPEFLHWHNNYEFCQVMTNKCRFLVNGVCIEAAAGDFVIIGENIVHRFMAEEETKVRVLQFSLKILIEAGIPIKRMKSHITAAEIKANPMLEQRVETLLEMIEAEGRLFVGEENCFQQCIVAAFYCLMMRYFEDLGTECISNEHGKFIEILQYISEHYEENININFLSEHLFMHRSRLSALFKKYSGMSPKEYIYSLRIKKANELMDRGYDITYAALQSGFQNVRTFNEIYKKMTNVTPTEYRKRHKLKKITPS